MNSNRTQRPAIRDTQRGGALIAVLIVVALLTTIIASVFSVNMAHQREARAVSSRTRALYLADAGISSSLMALAAAERGGTPPPVVHGTENAPQLLRGGRYWCTIQENADESFTVTSTALVGTQRRTVEAVIAPLQGVFDHAIFAGNADGDPNYELRLSGNGGQADEIIGHVYSGGDVTLDGDADISGEVSALGVINGTSGDEGVRRATPDIAGADYANTADFDVAALFAAGQSFQSNALGGSAYELPADSPAHIFRKNPDDRIAEISSTSKDDFFLEDPYMPVKDFTDAETGKDGHTITLSGTMGSGGPSGTDKVYFIDGNLWVHNRPFGRLRILNTDAEGVKVTFVVRGNIYFSDDVYVGDPTQDGVAFIAIEDAAEPDSGNIFLGDPRYGTLERMESFLYAENNFYDNNLSATGSATVKLRGNMTAGKKVSIQRDFALADGTIQHSQLMVQFDDRISSGALDLPGLPGTVGGVAGLEVVLWREVAVQ